MLNTVITTSAKELFEGRSSKYDEFLRVTADLELAPSKSYWVAGGLLRRVLTNQNIEDGDIDVFFRNDGNPEQFINLMKAKGWVDGDPFPLNHVKNLKKKMYKKEYKMQVIFLNMFPDIPACLDSFDYTICQLGYDGQNVITTPQCLMDNGNRRLVAHKITYPIASLRRLVKYSGQGYYACNGCLHELAKQIRDIPADHYFTNLNVTYID